MIRSHAADGQLPLALNLKEKPGFDLIIVGENVEAIQQVRSVARGISKHSLYLWGHTGCGISHLLQAACILADAQQLRIAYVPLSSEEMDPRMLENLENLDLVCIDDIDAIAGQPGWEQAILHLYNRLREAGTRMIIGAHSSPQAISLQLADLKSRMAWDLVYLVKPLGDADKLEALQLRSKARGFELPHEVAEYILNRTARDMPSLIARLDDLENASLIQQRKLTIPFVRKLLAER